ncbi:MAG: glycosyltransferase family 2 protein [Pseudomonadota bacterium]|nr:glycosyltransferase family 2 protein [Pseudomonadota bacterium]
MLLLTILVGCAALFLLLPVLVFFAEILAAVTKPPCLDLLHEKRPRIAVLMPAHNEASIITATLQSIAPQLNPSDRLLVIADNCVDDTAALARSAGAEVIERSDLQQRGKGYALDHGVRHLEGDSPEVVIIMDADCRAAPGCIDRLARLCSKTSRPIQALYLMHAAQDAGLKMRIAEFAWIVKNQARPEGLHRLGQPCQLMGTGMAFPWLRISKAKLASGEIVEDLKLGIDLARAGAAPLFCADALVTSDFPNSGEGVQGQRTRWEHGHLRLMMTEVPRLFVSSLFERNISLLALTLDLSVPPLALLTLLTAAVWCCSAILFLFTKAILPIGLASADVVLLILAVLMSWHRYGRRTISLGKLALALVYALWKIPLYARFLVDRQISWVRSKRNDE